MKMIPARHINPSAILWAWLLLVPVAPAVTVQFFDASQTATVVATNMTSTTVRSGSYQFTYSVDGWWSPVPGGSPTGRFQSVFWPDGIDAQAVTAGPTPGPARITIKRTDGKLFDLQSFTAKLLANTAGAGGMFEVMPQLDGEDALPDPLAFNATGSAGNSFTHHPGLAGYDTYIIKLYVDFALTALTLVDTNPVAPPATNTITATVAPAGAGTVTGAGTYAAGSTATLTATANSGFVFVNWTENGAVVETLPDYGFTVDGDRALVAHFTTNSAPLAFGGSFFQLTNHPLAINIADLTAFDYDPDGDPIYFAGVSVTTSNGLPLATNDTQILVPAGGVDDSFTYTITDGNGGIATGTAQITSIAQITSQALGLDCNAGPGGVWVSFTGVPWHAYTAERATNATFTGTVQSWPAQAWSDGSIYLWDNFADLTNKPPQAFYRLRWP